MTMEYSAKAIFVTNTFAQAHPEDHIKLWAQFEKEVPASNRLGPYGQDNVAYVKWLREQKNQLVQKFLADSILQRSY